MDAPAKILVYDGDCSMCTRLSRLAERRWLCGPARRRPFSDFAGDEAARLTAAGIHNELAVLDEASGEIRSGYDGIVWLLRDGRLGWLARLLGAGPMRWLLRLDYRLVAYNRRILAPPPPRAAACACDPDLHRGYRAAFLVACMLWCAVLGALGAWLFAPGRSFAQALTGAPGGPAAWSGAWIVPAAACAAALGVLRAPRERRLDLLGHLAFLAAALVLPVLGASALSLLGLGLGAATGLLPEAAASHPSLPGWIGGAAWLLALPVAVRAVPRRLVPGGLRKHVAWASALLLWMLPLLIVLG